MNITKELWRQIEPLLGAALDMAEAERAAWLIQLDATQPGVSPLLRKMIATHERAERARQMETVPKLAPPPARSQFAPGMLIGPFRLLRPIGRGGMGEVWLAAQADGRIEREVALKLPTTQQLSEVWRERFRRERNILARLSHAHIARLYDAGVSEVEGSRGQSYLAMEYVEGEPFNDYVATRKLPLQARLRLFRQVLDAVSHAHRHLVVHRDLKPANILVDNSGQVKLLDFGIAKLLDDSDGSETPELTRIGGRVMTLRYAAPEQVAEGVISTATDVYSLGVILHELIAGLSPYRVVREQRMLTDSALLSSEPALLSTLPLTDEAANERGLPSAQSLARAIDGDLDAIVLKAMRRNPADRYPSIEPFDSDIQRHLEHRPVRAREGTWRYLAGRFAARNKLTLGAAAVVLLTMLSSLILVEHQRRTAVAEKARAEKHFASIRTLANSFMFDLHDELDTLPGALKVREKLIATSLVYLDTLSREADNNPGLQFELASAYRRVANIQGQPGAANLGKLDDAIRNYEKSRQLFIALGNYKHDDIATQRERLMTHYALSRAYTQRGDKRWQEEIAIVVKQAALVSSLPGATSRDRARVGAAKAEEAHLTSINIGQNAEAENGIEQAIAQLEALYRELPGDGGVRNQLASTYTRAGEIFNGTRRTRDSVMRSNDYHAKAMALYASAMEGDPRDQRYLMELANGQVYRARNFSWLGDFAAADGAIAEARKRLNAMLAADRENADILDTLLDAHAAATRIASQKGDRAATIARAREGLRFFATFPPAKRELRHTRSVAKDIETDLALALLPAGKSAIRGAGQQGTSDEACRLLAGVTAFVAEIRQSGQGALADDEVARIAEGDRRCGER